MHAAPLALENEDEDVPQPKRQRAPSGCIVRESPKYSGDAMLHRLTPSQAPVSRAAALDLFGQYTFTGTAALPASAAPPLRSQPVRASPLS